MRFIHHQQMLIHIEDGFVKGDLFFVGNFAKIVNPQAGLVWSIMPDWLPMIIQHEFPFKPAKPVLTMDGREAVTQTIQNRWPVAVRQYKGAGLKMRWY